MKSIAPAPSVTWATLSSRPPIITTSAVGWPASAAAIGGELVRIVRAGSAGSRRASSRFVVEPSSRTTAASPSTRTPASASSAFASGAVSRRWAKLPGCGAGGSAPPCTRWTSPWAASSRRSRRTVSSDTPSSATSRAATTLPSRASTARIAWRRSAERSCAGSCTVVHGTACLSPTRICSLVTMSTTARPYEAVPPDAATVLRPGLPGLADEMIEAIAREVPAYARALEGEFGQAVRVGVEIALNRFLDLLADPDPDAARSGRTYVELGRGEFQAGRSLDALLAAYRVGARAGVAPVRRRRAATGGLDPDAIYALGGAIFAYIDELSAESAEGYAEEQTAAAGEQRAAAAAARAAARPGPARRAGGDPHRRDRRALAAAARRRRRARGGDRGRRRAGRGAPRLDRRAARPPARRGGDRRRGRRRRARLRPRSGRTRPPAPDRARARGRADRPRTDRRLAARRGARRGVRATRIGSPPPAGCASATPARSSSPTTTSRSSSSPPTPASPPTSPPPAWRRSPASPTARARGSPRRSPPGSTAPARSRPSRPRSASIPRPSATACASCATCSGSGSRTPTRGSSSPSRYVWDDRALLHLRPMRLLLTGAAGMLGQDVTAAATRAGHDVTPLSRHELDVRDAHATRVAIAAARPHAVINCAAWTDVDGAEANEAEATELNGAAAGHVADGGPARRRVRGPGLDGLRLRRDRARRRTPSPPRSVRRAPTAAPSSPASRPSPPRRPARTRSSAPPGCSAPAAATSSPPCCGSRASATG